jgi:hypothetical protein
MRIPQLSPQDRDFFPGLQGVGVIATQQPHLVGKHRLESLDRGSHIAALPAKVRHVVTGVQGTSVIRPQHPEPVGEQHRVFGGGTIVVARPESV